MIFAENSFLINESTNKNFFANAKYNCFYEAPVKHKHILPVDSIISAAGLFFDKFQDEISSIHEMIKEMTRNCVHMNTRARDGNSVRGIHLSDLAFSGVYLRKYTPCTIGHFWGLSLQCA